MDKRTEVVSVRVTKADKRLISKAVRTTKVRRGTLLRRILVDGLLDAVDRPGVFGGCPE